MLNGSTQPIRSHSAADGAAMTARPARAHCSWMASPGPQLQQQERPQARVVHVLLDGTPGGVAAVRVVFGQPLGVLDPVAVGAAGHAADGGRRRRLPAVADASLRLGGSAPDLPAWLRGDACRYCGFVGWAALSQVVG